MFGKKETSKSAHTSTTHKLARMVGAATVSERLPQALLIAFVFLLPVLFAPVSVASLPSIKLYFVYIVGALIAGGLLVRVLRASSVAVSINAVAITGALVTLGYIVAGLLSQHVPISLFGRDFAQDSVMAIVLLFALGTSVAVLSQKATTSMYVYTALVMSGAVVVVLHVLNILIPAFPSFGIFSSNIATTLGKWNDLGLFATLLVMVLVLAVERMTLTKPVRLFLCTLAVLSTLIVIFVNFTLSWWALGIFSLALLVQTFLQGKQNGTKKLSVRAIALFILCVVFLAFGQSIGSMVTQAVQIQHLEVRPSLEATLTIAQRALSGSDAFTGVGPALFEHVWPAFRPLSVLTSNFWNVDFRYGFGLLPTFVVTTGLIGAVSWVLFALSLVWVTVRAFRVRVEQPQDQFLLTAGAASMWFLWVVSAVYLPSATLMTLAVVSTGLFVGTAIRLGALPSIQVSLQSKVSSTIGRVLMVVCVVVLLGIGVQATAKFVAHAYFQKSISVLAATNDGSQIEPYLAKAVRLDGTDTYYRSLGEVGTAQLNAIIARADAGEQVDPEIFRAVANRVIQNYEQAIAYDPRNHNNYIGLANFYTGLAAIGTDGVYDAAKQLYSKALEVKPNNPAVYLAIAQLELASRNVPAARASIDKALELKQNYSEAYLFLTQLELSQGSRERATNVMRRAGAANPNDPFTYFQLGLLEYDNQNFDEAVLALERAVSLNPGFQNAKYFLGLSYYEVGEVASSLRQFEELYALNKTNSELQTIVENVRAGRAPVNARQQLETLELPLQDEDTSVENSEELESVE